MLCKALLLMLLASGVCADIQNKKESLVTEYSNIGDLGQYEWSFSKQFSPRVLMQASDKDIAAADHEAGRY